MNVCIFLYLLHTEYHNTIYRLYAAMVESLWVYLEHPWYLFTQSCKLHLKTSQKTSKIITHTHTQHKNTHSFPEKPSGQHHAWHFRQVESVDMMSTGAYTSTCLHARTHTLIVQIHCCSLHSTLHTWRWENCRQKVFVNTEHVALGAHTAGEVRLKNTEIKKDPWKINDKRFMPRCRVEDEKWTNNNNPVRERNQRGHQGKDI